MSLELWNKLNRPPSSALKPIMGGRLKGKTDINPQWRYLVLTEHFGICGIGWKYTIDELWTLPGPDGQTFAFARISLLVKHGDKWSDPIPGIGGSLLIAKEYEGYHANDEAYKMAVTDALSVACKMIGVAADVYMGLWDGSKFKRIEGLGHYEPTDADGRIPSNLENEIHEKITATIGPAGKTPPLPIRGDMAGQAQDTESLKGIVENVVVKDGKQKNGKPYTRYGIEISCGSEKSVYGTFDKTLGEEAIRLKDKIVVFDWKPDGTYKDLIAIKEMQLR